MSLNKKSSTEKETDNLEVPLKKEKDINLNNSHTFTYNSYYSFLTVSFVIQQFIKQFNYLIILDKRKREYYYDYNKSETILVSGIIAFIYNGKIIMYNVAPEDLGNTIMSNNNITDLIDILKDKIKNDNPLRYKHLQIIDTGDGFMGIFKKIPNINLDDVILKKELKDDLFDNTIFHLKNLNESNGIILEGIPGTGKSLVCSAIINETIKAGFSTCFITTQTNYTLLNEFIENFISPCIIILEDIDSFGQSREDTTNSHLADFLQFINGLSERTEKIIFIATTNYLEHLDKAIKDRPVRFNRKFKFDLPDNDIIKLLVDKYLGYDISEKYSELCYDKKFTGSHIKEIQRTTKLLALKNNKELIDVFPEAIKIIEQNFSPTLKSNIGFK